MIVENPWPSQIAHSLIERTVEGELIPMALELGLGVTPSSPPPSGVLSGKYTRENAKTVKADRGERVTQVGEHVHARLRDGERREVAALAPRADQRR